MAPSPVSRRTLLRVALAWLGARVAAWAGPSPRTPVPAPLAGYSRTSVHWCHYSVRATVTMLGIPIFSRQEVGGGYASVETGTSKTTKRTQATALQFAAGAWPHRAAGLNRFGIFKETLIEDAGVAPQVSFAGLMSSSKEANLDEARQALKSGGDVIELTMIRGGSQEGNAWAQTEDLTAQAPESWVEADGMLVAQLARAPETPPEYLNAQDVAPFLVTMQRAALCREPSFKTRFFHASKQFVLEAKWDVNDNELRGTIRSAEGHKLSEFRTRYAQGDASGVPVRIEYQPRSFLKLTFEADPEISTPPIPSLFPS